MSDYTARKGLELAVKLNEKTITDQKAEIERLQGIVDAQREIIGCYEDETERSQHGDDELPDDLLEAEQALVVAEEVKS